MTSTEVPALPPTPAVLRGSSLFFIAIWFGITAGLVEGLLLLVFQRINWRQWGRGIHVSSEILWISPLVDTGFFLAIAIGVAVAGRFISRLPASRVLIFVLAFLSVYDWMALTHRFYRRSCLLLALGAAVAFIRWIGKHESTVISSWKKSVTWALGVFLLTFAAIQGGEWLQERIATASLPSAVPGSPNVVVIVIDTLRADHVSSYGYSRQTTPEIDRLASQGVLFENAIAPCSWSLPSHASLLTGRYPLEHGMVNVQPMPWPGWGKGSLRGYPTLGEELQKKGYRTGAFSANRTFFTRGVGLGRGFIHFEDYFQSAADGFLRTLYGAEFARFYLYRTEKSKVTRALRALGMDSLLDKDSEGSFDAGGVHRVRKRAREVNRETLRWIDRERQRPFLAFLNYFDVHDPYGSPESTGSAASNRTDVDAYDDGLKYVDDSIANLMGQLELRGLGEHTLVIITSDHGEALGAHGLTFHGAALYREQIHVPLVMWYPGRIPAGIRVDRPVSNAGIPATIMNVVSPGNSVFPIPSVKQLWENSETASDWPEPISELARTTMILTADKRVEGKVPIATDADMYAMVTPRWHLIVHQKWGEQLYDWKTDIAESDNVIKQPSGQAVAPDLSRRLDLLTNAGLH